MTHGGVRWKTVELVHLRLDLRHELRRRRAGADDGDALAGEVVLVVPARGVEAVAREVVEAGDVGLVGLGGGADGARRGRRR